MGLHSRIAFPLLVASLMPMSCAQAPAQANESQEIYERAIAAIFREDVDVRRPHVVYVFESSETVERLPDSSYRSRGANGAGRRLVWGDIPPLLRQSFREAATRSRVIAAQTLPLQIHLRNDRDSTGIVVSVSPVAFTPDSTQALVYVAVHCGGICGGADVVYLRKGGFGWAVDATFPLWRS